MSSPRTVTFGAGDLQAVGRPGLAPAQLDQGNAGVTGLGEAVNQDRVGDRRQCEVGRSSGRPSPGMSKSMVFTPPVAALESRIAWRSEPGPVSAVLVTEKMPSLTTIMRMDCGGTLATRRSR